MAEALAESEKPICSDYGDVFLARAKRADAEGKTVAAEAWHLLARLSWLGLQEDNPAEPFRTGPLLMPNDLDQVTAEAVHRLGLATEDPELRARLLDVTWVRLRDAHAAREAVRSYVNSANRLFDPRDWPDYAQRAERALRLARQLRDQALVEAVLSDMEQKVIDLDGTDPLFMTSRLMELLHEFKKGDLEQMSRIARKAAQAAKEQNNFGQMRSHLENLRRWRRMADDPEGEREARIDVAGSYEMQAGLAGEGGELLAANLLGQAHQAYRNISGMRSKADEVYERLRTAQQRARDSTQAIYSDGMDISAAIKTARDRVSGKPFKEALLTLAMITRPTDFDKAAAVARELVEKYPLQNLLGGSMIEHDGRVVAYRTPALGGDEPQAEQALWERVVEQTRISYQWAVEAAIVPALSHLMFEHSPALRDMRDLVVHTPFVPRGREELFAKGLLVGLRFDFPEALSILVPQLENSLRHLLATANFEVTTRDKHGLQSVIPMGTILSDRNEQLEPILGADMVKELKLLFSDQHGPDLRNSIAHGLLGHDDFLSFYTIYAWWFILVLCILPVHRRFREEPKREDEEPAGH